MLKKTSKPIAPGPDGISQMLWKILCTDNNGATVEFLVCLFNMMLRTGSVIDHMKEAIMAPAWKAGHRNRKIQYLRPLILSNAIGKIFFGILNRRLHDAILENEVLDEAQEAGLRGHNTGGCLHVLQAILNDAKERRDTDLYIAMYDFSKAFDSIPWWLIKVAMSRIGVADAFTELILSSYRGSKVWIRTIHGLTAPMGVTIGIRQGDPISMLIFSIVMDILHAGCRTDPLTTEDNIGYFFYLFIYFFIFFQERWI
jgi:hypothetical protein